MNPLKDITNYWYFNTTIEERTDKWNIHFSHALENNKQKGFEYTDAFH